jgi:hypothetical protein
MKVQEIEIGKEYHITGDIENGLMNGKPYICHEEDTLKVTRMTDTHIICECGRKFLKNGNLTLTVPSHRK